MRRAVVLGLLLQYGQSLEDRLVQHPAFEFIGLYDLQNFRGRERKESLLRCAPSMGPILTSAHNISLRMKFTTPWTAQLLPLSREFYPSALLPLLHSLRNLPALRAEARLLEPQLEILNTSVNLLSTTNAVYSMNSRGTKCVALL